MQERLNVIQMTIQSKLAEKKILSNQMTEIDNEIKDLSRTNTNLHKAANFCDLLVEKFNQASVEDIEKLVTEGLQFVFQKPYKFHMNPDVKRGNMTYNFSLEIDGREIDNIIESEGGGIVSVISIIMRIITILIAEQPMKRVLFLDESLGMLSAEYLDNASRFIKNLGEKLSFTIVLVTHQEDFKAHADTVYEVTSGNVKKIK